MKATQQQNAHRERKEENIKVQAASESRGKAAAETTNIYEKYEQQTMCNIIEDDDVYTFQEKNEKRVSHIGME